MKSHSLLSNRIHHFLKTKHLIRIAGIVFLFLFMIGGAVTMYGKESPVHRAELRFTEKSSKNGVLGSMLPASCESAPWLAANGDGNYSGCVAPVCSAARYSCAPGTSANNSDNATTWTWTCTTADPSSTINCSEAKPPVVNINFN